MSTEIPDAYRELLTGPVYVQLATHMPDGTIQVNPVWCSFDGERIWINSAKGRVKDRNIRANPAVTVFAGDPENPYRWLEVRGVVNEITETGADEHVDDLAELYLNRRPYPFRQQGEERVIYKIRPQRVWAFSM